MKENKPVDPYAKYNEQSNIIAKIIFASRWLQVPIYLGLIVTLAIYSYKFIKGLWALVINVNDMDSNTIMLGVLNLIDVVMIANLLVMVTIGGYEIFVSKLRTRNHPAQPEWMSHVNATVLKVKIYRHFIYPYVANFCECKQYARKNDDVAVIVAFGLFSVGNCFSLYGQNFV